MSLDTAGYGKKRALLDRALSRQPSVRRVLLEALQQETRIDRCIAQRNAGVHDTLKCIIPGRLSV